MPLPDNCPDCGAGAEHSAFVDYEPAPNGAQEETEWGQDLESLKGVVCTECSYVLGVFDPRDIGEGNETDTSDFRVEGELR